VAHVEDPFPDFSVPPSASADGLSSDELQVAGFFFTEPRP
jgi:hypothetical protein